MSNDILGLVQDKTKLIKTRVASQKEINAVKECLVELDLGQFIDALVGNIDIINSVEDIENFGIPNPFSLYVMEIFCEVFTGASSCIPLVTDNHNFNEDLDVLSLNELSELQIEESSGDDTDSFLQDFFS